MWLPPFPTTLRCWPVGGLVCGASGLETTAVLCAFTLVYSSIYTIHMDLQYIIIPQPTVVMHSKLCTVDFDCPEGPVHVELPKAYTGLFI